MSKTRKARPLKRGKTTYRQATKRDAAIDRDCDRLARRIDFTRQLPATTAELLAEFHRRGHMSGSIISHLRHDYTNYDQLARKIAERHGTCSVNVPRHQLKSEANKIIWPYLNSIGWPYGELSPCQVRAAPVESG
jgi:hypothetical protein